jgi:hypothetical protein
MKARQALQNDVIKLTADLMLGGRKRAKLGRIRGKNNA